MTFWPPWPSGFPGLQNSGSAPDERLNSLSNMCARCQEFHCVGDLYWIQPSTRPKLSVDSFVVQKSKRRHILWLFRRSGATMDCRIRETFRRVRKTWVLRSIFSQQILRVDLVIIVRSPFMVWAPSGGSRAAVLWFRDVTHLLRTTPPPTEGLRKCQKCAIHFVPMRKQDTKQGGVDFAPQLLRHCF